MTAGERAQRVLDAVGRGTVLVRAWTVDGMAKGVFDGSIWLDAVAHCLDECGRRGADLVVIDAREVVFEPGAEGSKWSWYAPGYGYGTSWYMPPGRRFAAVDRLGRRDE